MSSTEVKSLSGKKILLGISGGIAAYKCPELVRRLTERGAQVRVVMTGSAKQFITPLTLQAVSGNPVSDDLLDPSAEASMGHIELAKWADLIVIAPATANIIAKLRNGMADDLLTTLALATNAPVAIAPAMNQQMWAHPATQENINALQERGVIQWGPAAGEQACGDVGLGRMLEPNQIVQECEHLLSEKNNILNGLKISITAGPTREPLDPVRYLTNQSSGKMGYAIATAAAQLGAKVSLISGPVSLTAPTNVDTIYTETALEMYQHAMTLSKSSDIFIGCAAVADYRPDSISKQKIKKNDDNATLTLKMVKNPDIIASVSNLTENRPFTVGFAAETQNLEEYAKDKLARKKLDIICANDVSNDQGFNQDSNALHLFWNEGDKQLPNTNKQALAYLLLEQIFTIYKNK